METISVLHLPQNIQKQEKTLCAAFKPNHTKNFKF